MRRKAIKRSNVRYVADMAFMQDILVTDVVEQERLWLIMYRHVQTQMSPLEAGLSIMAGVIVGAVARFTSINQVRQSALIVLQMGVQPQNSIIRKNIETSGQ